MFQVKTQWRNGAQACCWAIRIWPLTRPATAYTNVRVMEPLGMVDLYMASYIIAHNRRKVLWGLIHLANSVSTARMTSSKCRNIDCGGNTCA